MSAINTAMYEREYGVMFAVEDRHWWYRSLRSWLRRVLRAGLSPGARVLDAGCGTGANLALLDALGYRAVGLDLVPEALRFAARRPGLEGNLLRATASGLPFAAKTFDAIVSTDVLYLLDDAQEAAALAEFRRVLRPDGLLVLHLPAYEWLRGEHDQAIGTRRRYTRVDLRRKLQRAGLQPARIGYRYMALLPVAAAVRLLLRRPRRDPSAARSDLSLLPRPLNALLTILATFEDILGAVVPRCCGTSVWALARRKRSSGG